MTGAERLTYGKMPSWVVSPVGFLVWGHARTVRINRAEGDTLDAQGRFSDGPAAGVGCAGSRSDLPLRERDPDMGVTHPPVPLL